MTHPMYNNQKRVELVKRRIYERNCQQQRDGIYGRSAACMVLFAFLAGMLHVVFSVDFLFRAILYFPLNMFFQRLLTLIIA